MTYSEVKEWMQKNKKDYHSSFELAVECTSAFSLWGKTEEEYPIPQFIVEIAEQLEE